MEIEIGSLWKHKDCSAEAEVVQINLDERRCIIIGFRYVMNSSGGGSKTKSSFLDMFEPKFDSNRCFEPQAMKECLIKEQAYDEGFNDGVEETKSKIKEIVSDFTPTELESIASEAFDAGYDYAVGSIENLAEQKQQAYEDGFLAAVEEMTDCACDEEYSEYEFGAIDDYEPSGVDFMRSMLKDWSKSIDKETFSKQLSEIENKGSRKHSHYFKDTSKYDEVDTYLLARIWNIVDENGALLHALKKILDAGKRGAGKDKLKDIGEARDSLIRYLEIEEMFQGDKQ